MIVNHCTVVRETIAVAEEVAGQCSGSGSAMPV